MTSYQIEQIANEAEKEVENLSRNLSDVEYRECIELLIENLKARLSALEEG